MGREEQRGREPGRAGAEPETLWEEGWEMRPVMGGDRSVRPGPSRPRKDFSFFWARKSSAALSQEEPWSQAALLRMQEWEDQVGNQCNEPQERWCWLEPQWWQWWWWGVVESDYILKDLLMDWIKGITGSEESRMTVLAWELVGMERIA